MKLHLLLSATFVFSIASAQTANAQAAPAGPDVGIQRQGFIIGFSLGGGSVECDGCEALSGAAIDFHIGGMLRPNLALMFDGYAIAGDQGDNTTLAHAVDTLAVQYWPMPRLWLKGGIGAGLVRITNSRGDELGRSDLGTGVMLGAGYEIIQGRSFALDAQLRVASVVYPDEENLLNASLTVGFNWY